MSLASMISVANIRWLILFLCCWISFGNYYAFDNPSSLNRPLMQWLGSDFESYQYQLNAMYTIYSVPNIILPLFMGTLLDKFGTSKPLLGFAFLVTLGQGIFSLGVQVKSFPLILLGRFVFGLGGESLTVAQSRLVTDWFRGRELALAIGLTLSVARFGTVINNILSPSFALSYGLSGAVWIGFYSCVWSLLCTLLTIFLDGRFSEKGASVIHHEHGSCVSLTVHMSNILQLTWRHLQTFHPAFCYVCIIAFCFYGSLVPFNNVASDFLQLRYYPDDAVTSSYVMSIPDTLAIFLVPFMGTLVDRYGYKLHCLTIGGICMIFGHFLLAFTPFSPKLALCFNGIANSTLLVLWPWIPLLVDEPYWATAYGIVTMCMNAAYAFVPLVIAHAIALDATYTTAEIIFVMLTSIGTLFCLFLTSWNAIENLRLNEPERSATPIEHRFPLLSDDALQLTENIRHPYDHEP